MAYSAASQKRYNDKNYTFYALKLHKEKDSEVIAIIENLVDQGMSRQAAIKKLILDAHGIQK